mgnify:CR=1 FL=1
MGTVMGMKRNETIEQMAAIARMVRDGLMSERDSKGRPLPLRYWDALAAVEARS